jgi:hypothetical protein
MAAGEPLRFRDLRREISPVFHEAVLVGAMRPLSHAVLGTTPVI